MTTFQRVIDRLKSKTFEDVIAHMYLDQEGHVTIGVGHLIVDADAAKSLNLVNRQTGVAASEKEKQQDWQAVDAQPKGKKAAQYEPFTKLKMESTEIDTLLKKDLVGLEKQLKAIYPDYDTFPDNAKEGLIDMIFNLGQTKLKNKFKKFNEAVNTKNWAKAAQECHRKSIPVDRNQTIRSLFESLIPPSSWSLVEALSIPDQRRAFFLPLASIPPGRASIRTVDKSVFTLQESYVSNDTNTQTQKVILTIHIQPPAAGFTDEDGLPDPAIRLHSVSRGQIRFVPAQDGSSDRLILKTFQFVSCFANAVWWERWVEAGCIPQTIIYENVDRAHLETVLNAIQASTTAQDRVGSTFGLKFPLGVTQGNKATFITNFLAGKPGHELSAAAGAYLGRAGTANPATERLLHLQVYYEDHTDDRPHPMNPRELFYLLFGNDSAEARNHPLLRRLDEQGQQQTVQPDSKRMLLRPPLRTWKRVVWEADQEIQQHLAKWKPAGSLGSDRFFNDHRRNGRSFNDGNYTNFNKCNLFVSDIVLRAGFRINIHAVSATAWHYIDANSYTNLVHQGAGTSDRIGLQGQGEDAAVTWGWKVENWLRAKPEGDRQQLLNQAMTQEGRCFILAGARARQFVKKPLGNNVKGVANCPQSLRKTGIGHIVIVKEVLTQPKLVATVGEGFQTIRVRTMEASGAGAVSQEFNAQLGGVAGAAAAAKGFIRLHLIELHPGKDPDTLQGLRDLNVNSVNRNLLNTVNERARDTPLTHNSDGTPRAPGHCCHDQYPTPGVPTEINC